MAKKKIHVEYEVDRELTDELKLILKENPRFAPIKEKLVISACFLIRMDENSEAVEGKGKNVVLKKVAPEMRIMMEDEPHFVLIVDKHWWDSSSKVACRGTVSKMLSRISVEEDDEGIKTTVQKWDIEEMFSNLEHSGVYDDKTLHMKEIFEKQNARMLETAAHGINKQAAATKAKTEAAKPAAAPEPDEPVPSEPDEEERPRVVARPVPKKSVPAKSKKTEDEVDEPVRPPRRIPADPEPETDAVDGEPEPED